MNAMRTDPGMVEKRWRFGCLAVAGLVVVAGLAVLFSPIPGKIKRGLIEVVERRRAIEAPVPVPPSTPPEATVEEEGAPEDRVRIVERRVEVPVPAPPPAMPSGPVSYKKIEVAELFNGIRIETELQSEVGGIASVERLQPEAFEASFQLKIRVPEANASVEALAANNEDLPRMLPELPRLVETAEVSRFFHHLYDLKQRQVQANLTRLERVLSRHNFYDCDTVLEMRHPDSGRRVFFLQGEMDVVSDGSDGDRKPEIDPEIAGSSNFQATTSYGWAKRTERPNPVIPILEKKLVGYRERYKVRGLTRSENRFLEEQIDWLPKVIEDLRHRSFLVGDADPFIVIPLSTRAYRDSSDFIPGIGDFAVVVHGNRLFPAIVGDYGPTTKVGEASLRIAREIDPTASPYRRPVSDLSVSYLVFPGTAERPFGPPDLDHWHARCRELLADIGGVGPGFELHRWTDLLAEPPATEEPAASVGDAAEGDEGGPSEPEQGAEAEGAPAVDAGVEAGAPDDDGAGTSSGAGEGDGADGR